MDREREVREHLTRPGSARMASANSSKDARDDSRDITQDDVPRISAAERLTWRSNRGDSED